jgi:hypothetical protein
MKNLLREKQNVKNNMSVRELNNRKLYSRKTMMEKLVYILVLVCTLFVFSTSLVYGLLTIDDVTISNSISENDNLYMSFSATTDTNNNIDYVIYHNGNILANEDSYGLLVNYSMQGINNFTFVADDGVDVVSEERLVNVIDVPMVVSINSPSAQTYNNHSISVAVSLNMNANTCTYNANNSVSGSLSGSGQSFSGTINFAQDGSYSLTINCSNSFESKTSNVQFSIDTINPVILTKSSTVNSDGSVTFSATTDKVCICKYGTSNTDFNSMPYTFTNTNNLVHHTTLSGLSDGNYVYYLKCKSTSAENIANTETFSFNVVIKPKASIDIESVSSDTPLKAGTYVVKLTSSEQLVSAPSLYYNFNTDATQRFVTLTGSGTSWSGYMIINSDTPNLVGTFYYSGVDLNNNAGTQITSGQLFLVDTTAPVAPISVEAESQQNGYIKLKWYYDGEDVNKYNIYRSVSGDPQYVDYLDTTSSKQYIDEDTIEGVTYYYRVAAIDEAGNDGYLSEVMQASSIRLRNQEIYETQQNLQTNSITPTPQFLDVELASKVDQLITTLENHMLDIDIAKKDLDSVQDPAELKIINLLDLPEKISEAKKGLESTINEAKNLKTKPLSVSELDMKVNKLRMDGIKYKSMVVEDIIINEQSSFDQITQSIDVDDAIEEIVDPGLSKKILSEYSSKNKQLQDIISVNTDIIIFKIKYLEKDDYDKHTVVKKIVSSSVDLKDIIILETIPKSFERDAKDINFNIENQEQPTIVKADPVLRWDASEFNRKELYYMINNHAEMSAAKETKTVVLIKPTFNLSQTTTDDSDNLLTGFALVDIGEMNFKTIHLLIFIGILSIIGLSLYYVSLDRKEKQLMLNGNNKEHSIDNDFKHTSSKNNIYGAYTSNNGTNGTSKHTYVVVDEGSKQNSVHASMHTKKFNPENNLDFNDMSRRLDAANLLINSFDYEKSRQIYNSCIEFYKKHHFKSHSEKEDFKAMLDHLYIKLLAYRLVHVSRKSSKEIMQKNAVILDSICLKLYHSINDVSEEYRIDEKKFIDYLYNSTYHIKKMAS